MRDSTKTRVAKLESRAAPVEFPRFMVEFVDCRHDPDGSVWSRVCSCWDPRTGTSEESDAAWELVRHGSP